MPAFTVLNPATEEPVAQVPAASAEETDEAVARALAAQPAWRQVAPGERAALLRAFAGAVEAHLEELAGLEVTCSGHPVGNARWEAGNLRDVLRYSAAAPERLWGGLRPAPETAHAGARRQERQHRVRRLRPGAGRRHRAVRGVRQRRPGLLRPVADPGGARRLRPLHGAARAGGQGGRGRRPGQPG